MLYFFPPHPGPKAKLTRVALPSVNTCVWLAQLKYNGTHVVVWTDGKKCEIRDRKNNFLTLYRLTQEMESMILSLYAGKELVLDGEVLHTKAKRNGRQAVTNTIVLFDVLHEGTVCQKTTEERLQDLNRICKFPKDNEPGGRGKLVASCGNSHLWMAETFTSDFQYQFDMFFDFDASGKDRFPEIEGLMLKMKSGTLGTGVREYDVDWIVRCRKAKPKMYTL